MLHAIYIELLGIYFINILLVNSTAMNELKCVELENIEICP